MGKYKNKDTVEKARNIRDKKTESNNAKWYHYALVGVAGFILLLNWFYG